MSLSLIFVVASAISPPEAEAPAPEATPMEAARTEPATESPAAPPPAPTEPPGGYWTVAEQRERETKPHDGHDELTIGSVLASLGLIRAGAGVISVWMAYQPQFCATAETSSCSGLRNYGWVGVAEGGLMFGTGITYLAIGAARRQRYQRWERGEPLSLLRPRDVLDATQVGPWLIPLSTDGSSHVLSGAGLRVRLQF